MIFDEEYYTGIWGTVHRHDYCQSLAQQLVNQYGKVRFLDIGTGCGYLVKCLRELGAQAWGLEVSEYAFNNSCCPAFVRLGDVGNIPYPSHYFDVVHSQGLWEYIKPEDVERAWSECKRVGKIQLHNFETTQQVILPEYKVINLQTPQWWKNQFYPKVLIACPVYSGKDYSFQDWINQVKNLTYPNKEIFVVDNSKNHEMVEKYKDQINIIPLDTFYDDTWTRVTRSMEVIRQKFLQGDYTWWFNLESDIFSPLNVIEQLIKWGNDSDWISHAFPNRLSQADEQGIGCCLFSKKLMKNYSFLDAPEGATADGWLWNQIKDQRTFKVMELYGYFPLEHRKEPENG